MDSNNEWPKLAGIYKITCLNNGKVYIGKSINIDQRIKAHKYSGRKRQQRGRFPNAIKKYGWESFNVEILHTVENFDALRDNETLLFMESEYIRQFNTTDPSFGYNMCEYSNDFAGKKHTTESRLNMSKGRIGLKPSEETKLKMSKSRTGVKLSDDVKANMSKAQREKNQTEETKLNRLRCRLGKKHSEESIEKMRQAKLKKKLSNELIPCISEIG
jgi:group I intron endonuclease